MKLDWIRRPQLRYGAFAAVAFALSLRWTFPAEAMKERLIMEAGRRGWQIDVERVSAGGGLLGVRAQGVKLETSSGLAIPVDDITATLRVLPLLIGRRSVAFDAELYDGRVEGIADLSGDAHVALEVDEVDLAQALPLRKASGMDLLGKVTGEADVTFPATPGQRPTGHVDLTVEEAGIAGGQLPVPGMTSGFSLPRTELGEIVVAVKLADGRATFEKLEATGGDAEIRTDGLYFLVQPRMQFSPIAGKARVKVREAFWAKSGTQGLKGLAEAALAPAKGSDGSWNLSVSGSVGHPRVQPATGR